MGAFNILAPVLAFGSFLICLVSSILLLVSLNKGAGKGAVKWLVGLALGAFVFIIALKMPSDPASNMESSINTTAKTASQDKTTMNSSKEISVENDKQQSITSEEQLTAQSQPVQAKSVQTQHVEQTVNETTDPNDFEYSNINGRAMINKYIGNGGNVTIPSEINGMPVVFVSENAFNDCSNITSFSVSDGNKYYKSIDGLLYNTENNTLTLVACPRSLTEVKLPQNVATIGNFAFFRCTGLKSIEIPQSVTTIGISAFQDCTGIKSISIPQGVKHISNNSFFNCTGLTNVNIPEGVTGIGFNAFAACSNLNNINIPKSVARIADEAFAGCTNLYSITIKSPTTAMVEESVLPSETKIIGYDPSTAKDYASKFSRGFELIK